MIGSSLAVSILSANHASLFFHTQYNDVDIQAKAQASLIVQSTLSICSILFVIISLSSSVYCLAITIVYKINYLCSICFHICFSTQGVRNACLGIYVQILHILPLLLNLVFSLSSQQLLHIIYFLRFH